MTWPTPEHVKPSEDADWPRWVEPHASHVVKKVAENSDAPAHVSVPDWPEFHIDRAGKVTVLVRNEDEEKRALAEYVGQKAEPASEDPDAPLPISAQFDPDDAGDRNPPDGAMGEGTEKNGEDF